jgi:hypothetical protein
MSERTPRTTSLARAALVAALVALVAIAPSVRASDVSFDKVPANYAMMMKMSPQDLRKAMDPDQKGYVTYDDYMKFHEMMFQKMDKNHDGKVTAKEFAPSKTSE